MQAKVLICVLVGLLSVVEVHAECSWVLWSGLSVHDSSPKVKKGEYPKTLPWQVESAFPSGDKGFSLCVATMTKIAAESLRLETEAQKRDFTFSDLMSKSMGEVSYTMYFKEKGSSSMIFQRFQCLPDTLNPNK